MKSSSLPRIGPRFLTTSEAAALLNVSARTIVNWIHAGSIPYIELPSSGRRKDYRIPRMALLESLSGNYDLAAELQQLDRQVAEAGMDEEQIVDLVVGETKTPS